MKWFEDPEAGKGIEVVGDMRKFKEIAQHLKVLARARPEDKTLLVKGLQALN